LYSKEDTFVNATFCKIGIFLILIILCIFSFHSCIHKGTDSENPHIPVNEGITAQPDESRYDSIKPIEYSNMQYVGSVSYFPSASRTITGIDNGAYWFHEYLSPYSEETSHILFYIDYTEKGIRIPENTELTEDDLMGHIFFYQNHLIGLCNEYVFISNADGTNKKVIPIPDKGMVSQGDIIGAGENIFFMYGTEYGISQGKGYLYRLSLSGELTELLQFDVSDASYNISGYY
jgi:hypothetical protein